MKLKDILLDMNIGEVKENEEMKNHTTYKVGGVCNFFITPTSIDNLITLLKKLKELDVKYKIVGNETKYAFRQVCKETLDPKWANKKKLGFPVPIREWIKDEDVYNNIYKLFSEASEFFNTKNIIKLLEEHKKGKRDNSRKIWTIYSFLIWYQEYFVKR